MANSNDLKRIDVAVGVIFNSQGEVLVAKRPWYKGECWEFPGGKVESGELVEEALKRELLEEVGIIVSAHEQWLIIDHDYSDKSVRLKVHKVTEFKGEAKGLEGQRIKWLSPQKLIHLSVPEANKVIVRALMMR